MRIGIDADGCIADIGKEILTRLRLDGIEIPEGFEFQQFDIASQFPVDKEWIGNQFSDPTFWLNAVPFPDAWVMINKWFGDGHDIFVITCRWEGNRAETERWFYEWDIPFNEIFMGMPHGGKHEVMKKNDISILIEDREMEVERTLAAGLTGILLDRSWNTHLEGAIYAKDFYEIDRLITDGTI